VTLHRNYKEKEKRAMNAQRGRKGLRRTGPEDEACPNLKKGSDKGRKKKNEQKRW